MSKISNQNPTTPSFIELTPSTTTGNNTMVINNNSVINTGAVGSINGKVSGVDTLEALNGSTTNVKSSTLIKKIIATSGTINFDNNYQTAKLTDIEIGSNGSVNLIGHNLVKTIDVSIGGHFQYVADDMKYTLDATKNMKITSSDLEQLTKVSDFMHDTLSDQDYLISDHTNIGGLRAYQKLCKKFGNDTVQSFINSREEVVNINSITDPVMLAENISEDLGLFKSPLSSLFSEKNDIDFQSIDNLIYNNYFELTGVTKTSVRIQEIIPTEVVGEISSFLDLNDVDLSN
jgi:hypothetical protein